MFGSSACLFFAFSKPEHILNNFLILLHDISLMLEQGGYKGFYARNTIPLNPKVVDNIHKRGGTILGSSRGGHETSKIVNSIQDRGINQVE